MVMASGIARSTSYNTHDARLKKAELVCSLGCQSNSEQPGNEHLNDSDTEGTAVYSEARVTEVNTVCRRAAGKDLV